MQTKLYTALAVLLLGFAGCRYNPDGEYFKELDPEGNPPFVEVELNFDTDTLYICNNKWDLFQLQNKRRPGKVGQVYYRRTGDESNDQATRRIGTILVFPRISTRQTYTEYAVVYPIGYRKHCRLCWVLKDF